MFIGIIIILLLIGCLVIYGCSSTSIKEGLSSAPNPIAAPYVKPGTNIVVFNGREYRTIWDNKPDILPLVSPTTYMAEAKTAGITIFDNIYNNGGKGWRVKQNEYSGSAPAQLLASSQTAADAQALQVKIGGGLGSSKARIAAATADLNFIEADTSAEVAAGGAGDYSYIAEFAAWDDPAARGDQKDEGADGKTAAAKAATAWAARGAPTGAVPDGWQVADDNPDSVVVIKSFPWQSWMVYTNSGMSYWSKWWKAGTDDNRGPSGEGIGGLELYAPTLALAVARAADPNAVPLSASAVQAAALSTLTSGVSIGSGGDEYESGFTFLGFPDLWPLDDPSANSRRAFYSTLGTDLVTAENATYSSTGGFAGAAGALLGGFSRDAAARAAAAREGAVEAARMRAAGYAVLGFDPDASVYSVASYNARLTAAAANLDWYFDAVVPATATYSWTGGSNPVCPQTTVAGGEPDYCSGAQPGDLLLPLPTIAARRPAAVVPGVTRSRQPPGAAPASAIWSSGAFTAPGAGEWFGGGFGVADQQYPFGGSDPKSAAAAAHAVLYGFRAGVAGQNPAAVSPLGTAILLSRPICTCSNGIAATAGLSGADADVTGAAVGTEGSTGVATPGGQYCTTSTENCASCNTGWAITGTLGSQTCVQDKCTCSNGTAATGSACTTSTENCASCNTGWAITGTPGSQTCVQDNCTCSNGTAATGSACTTSTENCTKCHTGWTLTGDPGSQTCVQNNCTCLNGTSTKGANCTINNTTQCASCNTGWTLTGSQTCAPNQCTCNTGKPAKGKNCTKNNATQCSSCKPGYYLSADNCLPNECTCPAGTGTAATNANCTKNGLTKCSKCASGYNMGSDNICAANQQCGSFDCPTGRQHKSDYKKIVCQGAKCQDGECCNPIPQATCSPFICPTNSTLNSNAGTIKCAGPSCTDNECCTPNPKPTCYGDNMKCPTNFFLKSNGQKIKCANYTCNTDECCSANATCRIVKCGAQFNPKPITTICQGATCEPTECCNPNAVCLTYPCPTGMRQKTNASSITCIGATCVTPECCDAIPPPPPPPSFIVSPPPPPPPSFIVSPPAPPPSFIVSPPPPPPPSFIVSPQPAAPPPPSNRTHITDVTNITDTTDDPTNIYFPNANFITFSNGESNDQSSPLDQNADNYSKYNGWSSPQQTSLARTNNMFSETPLPPPAGIASFNNRSYNQS